jgi:hypothetical protein
VAAKIGTDWILCGIVKYVPSKDKYQVLF